MRLLRRATREPPPSIADYRSHHERYSFTVAAHLLPNIANWQGAGPTEAIRQAGDQGCCGVEVRGFEPLASSVRETIRVIG
jgi:hypothetical protein